MRVQTAHQTVLQKGMPRETIIVLTDAEVELLKLILVGYTNSTTDAEENFCTELWANLPPEVIS